MCAVSYRKFTWNDEVNYIHLCSMARKPTYNFPGKKTKATKTPQNTHPHKANYHFVNFPLRSLISWIVSQDSISQLFRYPNFLWISSLSCAHVIFSETKYWTKWQSWEGDIFNKIRDKCCYRKLWRASFILLTIKPDLLSEISNFQSPDKAEE